MWVGGWVGQAEEPRPPFRHPSPPPITLSRALPPPPGPGPSHTFSPQVRDKGQPVPLPVRAAQVHPAGPDGAAHLQHVHRRGLRAGGHHGPAVRRPGGVQPVPVQPHAAVLPGAGQVPGSGVEGPTQGVGGGRLEPFGVPGGGGLLCAPHMMSSAAESVLLLLCPTCPQAKQQSPGL